MLPRRPARLQAPRDRGRRRVARHDVDRFGGGRRTVFHGVMDERLQLFPQTGRRVRDAHPAAPPDFVFEPVLADFRDAHHVDIHAAPAAALDVEVAPQRLSRDHAAEARLFLGLPDRRIAAPFAVAHPPFRHDPALAPGGRHQGHLDVLLADPVGNDCGLVGSTRHLRSRLTGPPVGNHSALSAVGRRHERLKRVRGKNVPKSPAKYKRIHTTVVSPSRPSKSRLLSTSAIVCLQLWRVPILRRSVPRLDLA